MPRPFSCTIFRGFYFWLRPNMISIQKNMLEAVLVSQREAVAIEASPRSENHRKQHESMKFHVIPRKKNIKSNWQQLYNFLKKSWMFFGEVTGDTPSNSSPRYWGNHRRHHWFSSSASNCELIPAPLQLHHSRPQPGAGGDFCWWWLPHRRSFLGK